MTNKRLLKEYRALLKTPIENIYTQPLEDNILEWHYIIFAHSGDYKDGVYHGSLEFDKDYPMKPPKIKMFTPSGRFETGCRLCLSMSDYHPETWNPSWGVQTILLGLYSFMLEDEFGDGTIGSIKDSSINRQKYARESLEFNNANKIFQEIYENYKNTKPQKENQENIQEGLLCRYCYDSTGDLIQPCSCKGSNQWVHIECLAKWQYSCILAQSTHPKYQTGIEKICNVCQTPFKISKYSRGELMLNFTGEEIANLLEEGCYIVSSKESSKQNREIIEKHSTDKNLVENISHWTESIFLITKVTKIEKLPSNEDNIMGVSLTRQIDLNTYPNLYFRWQTYIRYLKCNTEGLKHYIGGPCQPLDPFGICEINLDNISEDGLDKLRISVIRTINHNNSAILFGPLESIIYVLNYNPGAFYIEGNNIDIRIIWGIAGWSRVQLLGEIARGSWGMCKGDIKEIFPNNNNLWLDIVKSSRPIYCGKNDFSDKYKLD